MLKDYKLWLKNSFVLAGLLLAIEYVIVLLASLIFEYFKWKQINFGTAASIAGAMLVGEIYSRNFKEIMPKNLRLKVASISTAIALISFAVIFYQVVLRNAESFMESLREPFFYIFLSILVLGVVITFLLIWWLLGVGGKLYLKKLEKKEKKNKK